MTEQKVIQNNFDDNKDNQDYPGDNQNRHVNFGNDKVNFQTNQLDVTDPDIEIEKKEEKPKSVEDYQEGLYESNRFEFKN